jgi:hypothetical protein
MFSFLVIAALHVDVQWTCLLTIAGRSGESKISSAHYILMLVRGAGWFVAESRIEIGHKSRN